NKARAMYAGGFVVSNEAVRKVKVLPDPVFDYSTIIGKVFNDRNSNGRQDPGEAGINGVKITTEDGIVVTTDADGKYHIAGLKPRTKLIKLNENSLPLGSSLTTSNPYVARFTLGGTLARVNFGVRLPGSLASESAPRGELVIPVEVIIDGKEGGFKPAAHQIRIRIGGETLPLKWTRPKKSSDETTLLRSQIEKFRTESKSYQNKSEEVAALSALLKEQAEKTTSQQVKKTLQKRSVELQVESEELRQKAMEFKARVEANAEKIKDETDSLKITISKLKEKVKQLNRESKDLETESETVRVEGEGLRTTDRKSSDILLRVVKNLKEKSRQQAIKARGLSREIVKLNVELTRQKFFVEKTKRETEVKINGR
ncbi:MAG: hypothetical protein KAI63_07830, partial [Planctomycetes bacterium]|nr:hypothetical protein [Planctomycetota bacterium]